jgi:hypothetical protein
MRIISYWPNRALSQGEIVNIDKLTDNDIVHIQDVFDQNNLNWLFKKGNPKYIVSNFITWVDSPIFYGLPFFANYALKSITKVLDFDNNFNTSTCFNFMINKKSISRFLCIKLVELFKLNDFDYTWSAVDTMADMSDTITELTMLGNKSPLDSTAQSFLMSPIELKKKFITFSTDNNYLKNNIGEGNYGDNAWAWKNGLQTIFLNSAISLITEPLTYHRGSYFTEKTLYSVLGLTFPIWIGGYNMANDWKKLGFDVFDDIIDHSYQCYDTLIERCYYAVSLNYELLSNRNKISEFRLICKDRLLKNRELLLQNQLEKFMNQATSNFPQDLQVAIPNIIDSINSGKL